MRLEIEREELCVLHAAVKEWALVFAHSLRCVTTFGKSSHLIIDLETTTFFSQDSLWIKVMDLETLPNETSVSERHESWATPPGSVFVCMGREVWGDLGKKPVSHSLAIKTEMFPSEVLSTFSSHWGRVPLGLLSCVFRGCNQIIPHESL